MAINYSRVNWDTTKYVNPTNMNQMDKGIKDACDGVDNLETEFDTVIGDTSVLPSPTHDICTNISEVNSNLQAKAGKLMGLLGASKTIQLRNNMSHILIVTDTVREKFALYSISSSYGMVKAIKISGNLETELNISTHYDSTMSTYTVNDSDSGTVNKIYFVLG